MKSSDIVQIQVCSNHDSQELDWATLNFSIVFICTLEVIFNKQAHIKFRLGENQFWVGILGAYLLNVSIVFQFEEGI
jgi:hypothetical protein